MSNENVLKIVPTAAPPLGRSERLVHLQAARDSQANESSLYYWAICVAIDDMIGAIGRASKDSLIELLQVDKHKDDLDPELNQWTCT